jgi:hypothetical protein
LQVRNLVKARRAEVIWKNYLSFNSKEFLEALLKVINLEFEDYNDFVKKYGLPLAENPVAVALCMVCNLFEGAGELLHKGLADYETVSNIPTGMTWEKMKPIVEGARKQYNFPVLWTDFEYLYNEMKKREQKLQQSTVKGEQTNL